MRNKIVILGSCVSRDIFNFEKGVEVDDYFPRTTLRSVFGKRYNIKLEEIISDSQYRSKCIYRDLNSKFLDYNLNDRVLVLDFIDERCKILKINDECIGTASWEYCTSNLPETLMGVTTHINSFEEWKIGCDFFVDYCREKGILDKIILHKCFYKEKYFSKGNEVKVFNDRMDEIKAANKELSRKYDYIEEKIQGIKLISDFKEKYISNEMHRWGLSPFHYEDEYYKHLGKQVIKIMEDIDRRNV